MLKNQFKPGFLLLSFSFVLLSCSEEKVDFNADVRPILNKNCISCHGGVKQSGGFGLVFRENALKETLSGKFGIVPGKPGKSELIARITHKDPDMRMPLDKDPLSIEEITTLTKWIEQGAEWQEHWAYLPPAQPTIPETDSDWPSNDIDRFTLAKMEENKLSPSERADKYDLMRRLYLDIIGVPPTLTQAQNFVNDESEKAYEKQVDLLLSSPKYGEHWASMWLDLARYSDSRGSEKDSPREIWRYRDWVIKAFNDDLPFDQFTIEQLAGDLIPNASLDQMIATAFHRNTLTNDEGGTDNEENRVAAVLDRVNTTWEVWQSTTMSCVQCHSHPYDPIVQKEYYNAYAVFNNTSDWDSPGDIPVLKELNKEDDVTLAEIKKWVEKSTGKPKANELEKLVKITEPKLRPEDYSMTKNTKHFNRGDQNEMYIYDKSEIHIDNLEADNLNRFYVNIRNWSGKPFTIKILSNDELIGSATLNTPNRFQMIPISIEGNRVYSDVVFQFLSQNDEPIGVIDGILPFGGFIEENDTAFYSKLDDLLNAQATGGTPIMVDKEPLKYRTTTVFERGNWLVSGDTVQAGLPELMNPSGIEIQNRYDFAKWLVSDENTLTHRVMVNRIWAKLFGAGIVATVEDLGTLGELPTHPELLDHLALKFSQEYNWSMKSLIKEMVMSSTYQQSSKITEEKLALDAANKWLSRSTRVRLSAEQVRDQALSVSGLLSDKMYGPSVMPYQPDGVWSVVYSNLSWQTSEGEDAYRRGLYTYLRRSSPYPSFILFDASEREVCTSRRINTNTPLQALVSLNDPVYMETARNLATSLRDKADTPEDWATLGYQSVMSKPITEEKLNLLVKLQKEMESYYSENREEAYEVAKSNDLTLARLTMMANVLMNMDEFLVKN